MRAAAHAARYEDPPRRRGHGHGGAAARRAADARAPDAGRRTIRSCRCSCAASATPRGLDACALFDRHAAGRGGGRRIPVAAGLRRRARAGRRLHGREPRAAGRWARWSDMPGLPGAARHDDPAARRAASPRTADAAGRRRKCACCRSTAWLETVDPALPRRALARRSRPARSRSPPIPARERIRGEPAAVRLDRRGRAPDRDPAAGASKSPARVRSLVRQLVITTAILLGARRAPRRARARAAHRRAAAGARAFGAAASARATSPPRFRSRARRRSRRSRARWTTCAGTCSTSRPRCASARPRPRPCSRASSRASMRSTPSGASATSIRRPRACSARPPRS